MSTTLSPSHQRNIFNSAPVKVGFNQNDCSLRYKYSPDFYGAIIGTVLAIAIMVAAFFIAPLFIAIPLLIVGVVSIIVAAALVVVKNLLLSINNRFRSIEIDENGIQSSYNVEHTTKDGTILRGIFQKNETTTRPVKDRSLVILFSGNGDDRAKVSRYERFPFANHEGPFPQHDVLWFGYRGALLSTGRFPTHQQNVNDAVEIIKRAYKEGYTDVKLYGLSFGGAVASGAKAQLIAENHMKHQSIPLVAAHTFSTLETFISGKPCVSACMKKIIKSITKFIFRMFGYNYNMSQEKWHKTMGTQNVIIGAGATDTIINREMALARLFKEKEESRTTRNSEASLGYAAPPTSELHNGTTVIMHTANHGRVNWKVLAPHIQKALGIKKTTLSFF